MRRDITILAAVAIGMSLASCSDRQPSGSTQEHSVIETPQKKAKVAKAKKASKAKKDKGQKPVDQTATLAGLIDGQYAINMTIDCKGGEVNGTYYYTKKGAGATLNLWGTLDDEGNLELHETTDDGAPTGHFEGVYGRHSGYQGMFVNYQGTRMPFELTVTDVTDFGGDGEGRGFLYDYD